MSKINSRSKSSLFLMELIIVLLFFSISAAICMKVFASAKVKTQMSRDMSNASFAAESLAEAFKAEKMDGKPMSALYPNATEYDGVMTVYYDADWALAEKYEGKYRATLEEHLDGPVTEALIKVYAENGDLLFDIVAAAANLGEVQADGN